MSKSSKESKQGCIISNSVDSFIKHGSNNIGKYIAFIMKDGTIIKARIRIAGKINDSEFVYGLELDNDFQCTVGEDLKKEYHWNYKFLILVKQSIDFVEIDDKIGYVKSPLTNEAPGKFKNDELVLVKLKDSYKAAKIIKAGTIEGIFCYEIKLFQELCGERNLIVLESDVIKMLNEGLIFCQSYLELEEEDVLTLSIGGNFKNEDWEGILKWKGRVNGCPCVGIDNEEYESTDDFSKLAKKKDLYCVLIPLELKENIKERKENIPPLIKNGTSFINLINEINDDYPHARCIISEPERFKIKGDDDTFSTFIIVNSMFLFSEIFDKILFGDKNIKEVVFSMRKKEDDIDWKKLSDYLKKDKEDLFEGFLNTMSFSFRMYNFDRETEGTKPFISLSSKMIKNNNGDRQMLELLSLHCIEERQLLLYPPKIFIIKLEMDGVEIPIPSKLDITKLTVTCANCCSVCSSEAAWLCYNCSQGQSDVIYFCQDHKIHCKHEKKQIIKKGWKEIKGKTELDLVSVLCSQDRSYNKAYMATLDVNGIWSYLSIKNNGEVDHKPLTWGNCKKDIQDSKRKVSICIYKYAPTIYYDNDF